MDNTLEHSGLITIGILLHHGVKNLPDAAFADPLFATGDSLIKDGLQLFQGGNGL